MFEKSNIHVITKGSHISHSYIIRVSTTYPTVELKQTTSPKFENMSKFTQIRVRVSAPMTERGP